MIQVLKIDYPVELLLKVVNREIWVTMTTYDIISHKPVCVQKDGEFRFRLYDTIYIIHCIDNIEMISVILYNGKQKMVKPEKVPLHVFYEKSIKMDRKNLLLEAYKAQKVFIHKREFICNEEKRNRLLGIVHAEEWMTQGNEMDKIRTVMDYIDKTFVHNGMADLYGQKDAYNIIKACNGDKELSCRGLAIVCTELIIAMGMQARLVICAQKEQLIDDCHVVTEAYINEFNKWIMVDPSYNLLISKNGVFLSIREIREELCEEHVDLQISKAATSDGMKINKQLYLHALTKKFYRFMIPTINEVGNLDNNDKEMLVPDVSLLYDEEEYDEPISFWR